MRYTLRSVELAAEAGARFVVVHLGHVGGEELAGDRRLRVLYERGETAGDEWAHASNEAIEMRARARASVLGAGAALARRAGGGGGGGRSDAGLECRLSYHQIPLPEEAVDLLAGYPPEVAGYWHDVGHAEVLHRLGLVALDSWFELLGDRLVGTHLQDVRGILDHRAPGNGDVDFAALAARIPPDAARTLEIAQHEPDADLARGLTLLRDAGVVG